MQSSDATTISHIQENVPALKLAVVGEAWPWANAIAYKHGPPHDLDLDLNDVMDELSMYKSKMENLGGDEGSDDDDILVD